MICNCGCFILDFHEEPAEFELDFYNNGRERGYVLQLKYVDSDFIFDSSVSRWIAFSENRNSDDTVVYTDCGYWNGEITEKSWKEAKYFSYKNFIECADYIIKLMEESIEVVRNKRKELQGYSPETPVACDVCNGK